MARKLPPIETRFKKGQSGNPLGGKLHNPAIRAINKLTVETYREVIQLVLTGNLSDLKAMVENKKTPAIQVGVATAFLKAIKNGDYTVIERIAERITGKIPDVININSTNANLNSDVPFEKAAIRAAMKKLENEF